MEIGSRRGGAETRRNRIRSPPRLRASTVNEVLLATLRSKRDTTSMPRKPTIALVGAGNLGSVLARALHVAGYRVEEIVARERSQSMRRAHQLARAVKA